MPCCTKTPKRPGNCGIVNAAKVFIFFILFLLEILSFLSCAAGRQHLKLGFVSDPLMPLIRYSPDISHIHFTETFLLAVSPIIHRFHLNINNFPAR